MGSFATGFLLMGIALVYGATGSFDITVIGQRLAEHSGEMKPFFYAGVLMMLIGMTFKMSAVPFHFWAPDVYEGSPSAVTAFMSTVVKIAAFGAFYRVFSFCFTSVQSTWLGVIQVITVLTLVLANVTAVYQSSVKRMLAYSSVGHVGYILLAFISNDKASATTIFFYLTAYSVASLAAFGIVMTLERTGAATVDSFAGLFKRNPLLAVGMTVAMLSLAGIPPLGGFFGKYLVFSLAINNGYTGLVIVAIVTSLIGVYYYFRVIIAMYFKEPQAETSLEISGSQKVFILLLIALSVLLGVFPDCLLSLSLR
jgi:NADH-quinone oxidoreductase subunit N